MTEEEFFVSNYPDSCYGDKPLSPHWDFFQDGVEFGERQSKEKIQKLEQENTELKTKKIPLLERRIASIRGSHSVDAKKLNARTEQVERLKKENTDLKCECRRCIHTDCPCVLSDYGKDRNGICDHFKDVFDENAQLKEANETLATMNNNMWVELEKKRAESQGITNKLHQLIKAKEIIREFVEWATWQGSNCPSFKSIQDKAEQFLSEVGK